MRQGIYRTARRDIPEAVVAYEEDFVMETYEKAGLRDVTVRYGGWCGRERLLSQHDIVLSGTRV